MRLRAALLQCMVVVSVMGLALLLILPALAIEPGTWEEVGMGSASGNGIATVAGYGPSLAILPDNTPCLAWVYSDDIYVRCYNGTDWVEHGTGSASGGGVSNTPTTVSLSPVLAAAPDGTLYAAWVEVPQTYRYRIYVRRFNGNTWEEVGTGSASGAGISGQYDAFLPTLVVTPNGTPFIAWQKNYSGQIYVRYFDGTAWVEAGAGSASNGGISNTDYGSLAPSLAAAPDSEMVCAAWSEHNTSGGSGQIYLRCFDGSTWVEVGGASASGNGVSNSTGQSSYPALAIAPGGILYLAWQEYDTFGTNIYVKYYTGAAWEEAGAGSASGGGISQSAWRSINATVTVGPSGTPYLGWMAVRSYATATPPVFFPPAFEETPQPQFPSTDQIDVYILSFNETTENWEEVGAGSASSGGVSSSANESWDPQLAIAPDGTPYLAWREYEYYGYSSAYLRRFNAGESLELVTNGSLPVYQGGTGTITGFMLRAVDPLHPTADLTYTVASGPTQGTLNLGTSFTQQDINDDLLIYTHTGTGADSFTFTVSNGTTTIGPFMFEITIESAPPELVTNAGLTIPQVGGSGSIGTAQLETTDTDNDPAELTYTVTVGPSEGTLNLPTTFTQQDINDGLLTYTHGGYPAPPDGARTPDAPYENDSFTFTVTDGYTTIGPFTFDITIENTAPTLVTNAGLSVYLESTATISVSVLETTDADNTPAELTYTVTAGPSEGTLSLGASFTQQDINDGLLSYTHGGPPFAPPGLRFEDLVYGPDSFTFTVSDGYTTIGPYTFDITITVDGLTAGWYEETEPLLNYNEQWKFKAKNLASGGAAAKAKVGAVVDFWFEGDLLILYRLIGQNEGMMQVCVDGACQLVQNYFGGDNEWTQPVAFGPYAGGVHYVEISRPANEARFWLDAIQVVDLASAVPALPTGVIAHDTDASFFYTGNWLTKSKPAAIGGIVHKARRWYVGVYFHFTGDEFTLYRRVGPVDGGMIVCIDGTCQTVSNYSGVKQWGVPVTFSGLGAGPHVVGVYRNPGGKLFFDGVWVGPGAPSGPVEPPPPPPDEPAPDEPAPDEPGLRDEPDTPTEPRRPHDDPSPDSTMRGG